MNIDEVNDDRTRASRRYTGVLFNELCIYIYDKNKK